MRGEPEAKIRGRVARIGFSSARADTPVAQLSGGEKARLADGPGDLRRPAIADPRRADQPSRHRQPRRTDRGDQRVRRRLHPHLARSAAAGSLRRPAVAGRGRASARPSTATSTITPRLVLGQPGDEKPPPTPKVVAPARRQELSLERQIAAAEQKMQTLSGPADRVDEALAKATANGGGLDAGARSCRQASGT